MCEKVKRSQVKQFSHSAGRDLCQELLAPSLDMICDAPLSREYQFDANGEGECLPEGTNVVLHVNSQDQCELLLANEVIGICEGASAAELYRRSGADAWISGNIRDCCPVSNSYTVQVC